MAKKNNGNKGNSRMGRQKIEIKKITNEEARQVCFSKRRNGLIKKAGELSILCGAEVAIIVFSPAGKAFSYGDPSVDAVVNRFLDPTAHLPTPHDAHRTYTVQELNSQHDMLVQQIEVEKKRHVELQKQLQSKGQGRINSFWDTNVGNLSPEQLEEFMGALEEMKSALANRANELMMGMGMVHLPASDSPSFSLPPPFASNPSTASLPFHSIDDNSTTMPFLDSSKPFNGSSGVHATMQMIPGDDFLQNQMDADVGNLSPEQLEDFTGALEEMKSALANRANELMMGMGMVHLPASDSPSLPLPPPFASNPSAASLPFHSIDDNSTTMPFVDSNKPFIGSSGVPGTMQMIPGDDFLQNQMDADVGNLSPEQLEEFTDALEEMKSANELMMGMGMVHLPASDSHHLHQQFPPPSLPLPPPFASNPSTASLPFQSIDDNSTTMPFLDSNNPFIGSSGVHETMAMIPGDDFLQNQMVGRIDSFWDADVGNLSPEQLEEFTGALEEMKSANELMMGMSMVHLPASAAHHQFPQPALPFPPPFASKLTTTSLPFHSLLGGHINNSATIPFVNSNNVPFVVSSAVHGTMAISGDYFFQNQTADPPFQLL